MSDYTHPRQDVDFVLNEVIGFDQFCQDAKLEDVNAELTSVILSEAARLGSEVIAPLNHSGDQQGATLTDAGVQQADGFSQAYQQYVEGGWASLTASLEFGGQGLPNLLGTAVNEIWQSANLAFSLCPMLGQGAIEAIEHHGSDTLKQTWLPKMISGEWTGTMNLTEPDAGTDLAAIKSRATPSGDHYLISGQKIFITWGDHQMTDNVVHLVLARLPDAPAGVKGISLFVVPKFLLNEQGEPCARNDAHCIALEHKLGIHASPTCVMSFGDNGGAVGYLVGEAHQGLKAMFTMMNHARQGVGLQGLAVSERAYQQARTYAKERLQGTRKDGSRFPIIEFPDVRRMLMVQKAGIEAMRALAYEASLEIDRLGYADNAEDKAQHKARIELCTPIVKGWITELAQELTSNAVQIHGGMGFIEETGVAQHYRDARILPIYEGTTGIQALDLIGRKMLLNRGESMAVLLADMQATVTELADDPELALIAQSLAAALADATEARQWLLDQSGQQAQLAETVAWHYLMMSGYLCGGWMLARSALCARKSLCEGRGDARFLQAKVATASFYMSQLLPRAHAHFAGVQAGTDTVLALSDDQF